MEITKVTMMNMGITAVISIVLPFVLLILWKKRHKKISGRPLAAGILVYVGFALILESVCHQFFLIKPSGLSEFINGNTWAYVLYGALAAGVFEETGRLIAYKFFMKKENEKEAAVTYGIGHGGAESVIVVGFSMISSIMLMQMIIKMGGVESYVALVPAESQDILRESLNGLFATAPYVYLLAGVERIAMIIFQIALSVLVFFAAKRPGKWYFYPLAILFHVILDVFAVLYQRGVITSIVLTEAIIIVITAAVTFFTYRIYQKDEVM